MLVKDPVKRLSLLKDVKNHPWFSKHISFEAIANRTEPAPFVPERRTENSEKLFGSDKSVEAISHLFL